MEQDKQLFGKSWAGLFTLAFFVFAGLFVSQALGWLVMVLFGLDTSTFSMEALTQSPGNQTALLCMQLAYSATLFIAAPFAFYRLSEPTGLRLNTSSRHPEWPILGVLAAAITFVYLPTSGFLVNTFAEMPLPEGFEALEEILLKQEKSLQELSNYLTDFSGFSTLVLGLLVIAIVPAIGEELLFRGLIQRYLQNIFGNPHIGIIAAGFLFSAFHLQFYGLIPRMALGIIFGYLYYWSGRISTAMIAHFINNGVTLLAIYFFKNGNSEIDIESIGQELSFIHVLISLCLTSGLLFFFKKKTETIS